MTITPVLLKKFLELASKRLKGSWVVIGGSVLHALNLEPRPTLDIDLAGPETATQEDTIALMEIAESIGLPVEAINQAGAFFLRKISGWEKDLVLLYKGKKATFLRPNATLFTLLKVVRLSESDLDDCLAMIKYAHAANEKIDLKRVLGAIARERKTSPTQARMKRLETLQKNVES